MTFDQLAKDFTDRVEDLTRRYYDGEISPLEWYESFTQNVREGHINSYAIGRDIVIKPDSFKLRPEDILLGEQEFYNYLPNIADFGDKLPEYTLEQALHRASLYLVSMRGTANEAYRFELGNTEIKWVTTAKESCVDCMHFASLGYMPADSWPTAPKKAQTECNVGCKCYFTTKNGLRSL